ncbi:bile acid:sodium symporter family protein [Glutamicibacter protophormiae]|uniref:BASS family bile acid:Na+ symporter n=1 Tax=Glutamicibacter protophormiae TaxID=37930 RepID=A0ABS4XNA8_GLUPR|nr:bile acid:sodium symporter family protein [Glutamicibacter protophormiae]MBP2397979.1 BASS family bile acid:Na+ symporter [Glutamicibacter protophormiae]WPR64773.1 bile acid:sodium symporter family protein [Glutamicibacter protophormiae]WPR68269.1 bile acid:sodium symporter family protein [Glutamicibacter protophormiae]GGL96862.1 Na+-dependent transporter [Glutamicibacter protophormiae]
MLNDDATTQDTGAGQTKTERESQIAVLLFPALILLGGVSGVLVPQVFSGLSSWINPLLMVIMFCMGLSLTLPDFGLVFKNPLPVLGGVAAQFMVMPAMGWLVAWGLNLDPALAAGLILVGCAPGGTASNVVAYLARGNVALSVSMTSLSTLVAPVFTPLLAFWLAGQYLPVDARSMAGTVFQVVLIPVVLGIVLRMLLNSVVLGILAALPWLSVAAITIVVTIIVAGSSEAIMSAGLLVFLAVALHNGLGLLLGYGIGKLLRVPEESRRTIAIEVGMQNSGLAGGLAKQYFTPEAALPAAVFSVWHNLSGAVISSLWRRKDRGE